jgi:YD repeat-containing protein
MNRWWQFLSLTLATNAAGIVTATAYETAYRTFPAQETVAGTFTTTLLTDPESKVRKFRLDGFGRTNQIVEVTSNTTFTSTLHHDRLGQLTNLTDHTGNKIEYAHNDLGEVVAMADPNLGVWEYRREAAGRIKEQVDGNGTLTRFDYTDPLGRLKKREAFDRDQVLRLGATNVYDTGEA